MQQAPDDQQQTNLYHEVTSDTERQQRTQQATDYKHQVTDYKKHALQQPTTA